MKGKRLRSGTRVVFTSEGGRRRVAVEGTGLADAERRRLRALLRPVPIPKGVVTIRRDWLGRQRVAFSREIPESLQQVVRNLVGNLSRLRGL